MDRKFSSLVRVRAFGLILVACGLIMVSGSFFAARAHRTLYVFPTYQPASPLQFAIGGTLFVILGVFLLRRAESKAK
jgi:hypothetical protein